MNDFKVGDRIKYTSKHPKWDGQIGTIVKEVRQISPHIWVRFDNGRMRSILKIRTTLIQDEIKDSFYAETRKETIEVQPIGPIVTIQDAFRLHWQESKPKLHGQALAWAKEGRCPECGELGRYHLSQAVCSKHGPY